MKEACLQEEAQMPTTAATTTRPADGADRFARNTEAVTHADADRRREEALVDLEIEQSFPASDPPSWTLGTH